MQIELLVVPDCPHEAAAADLITTAVADTRVRATVTRTVIDPCGTLLALPEPRALSECIRARLFVAGTQDFREKRVRAAQVPQLAQLAGDEYACTFRDVVDGRDLLGAAQVFERDVVLVQLGRGIAREAQRR